ncbi:MAG: exonuclease domain-containing protein [Salinivirgaceae bacterium]|nr:exonuclease domain-containing protein [Salinivirgaceae bacterium]
MRYAIIDIETTGGSPKTEKITEIAIFVHDGEKVIEEFETLINPEMYIPPYITGLTGITNEMVASAPKFYEVAKQIVNITEDTIFVAHNVNFDYGFVKQEFKNLGFGYERKILDTIRLSRKLLPGHASYSLGKICDDLDIKINGRHRAAGDALATVKLFELLLSKNEAFAEAADPEKYKLLKGIDSSLHREILAKLPEAIGVYYFYDEHKNLIYIGKSINIKKRTAQHLRNSGGRKALEMREKVNEITFELTGSELVALLKESEEIKQFKPIYNRAQRRSMFTYCLFSGYDPNGYVVFNLGTVNKNSGLPIAAFANSAEGKNYFFKMVEKYQLCQKLSGLYKTDGACFHQGIDICKGACIGKESAKDYNERAMALIKSFEYRVSDFYILDKGRSVDEKAVIAVRKGHYTGFGYINTEFTSDIGQFGDCIKSYNDNREVQQIIKNCLRKENYEKVIYVEDLDQ